MRLATSIRKTRYILSIILSLSLMLVLIPPPESKAFASQDEAVATSQDSRLTSGDWEYGLDSKNQATITAYKGSARDLVIPDTIDGYPVVGIAEEVFQGNARLISVIIPHTVTNIGSDAFNSCTALTSVDLPRSLKSLGADAFYKCTALRSIEIPASLEECEGYLAYNYSGGPFSGCSALREVAFERGATRVASHLFEKCDGIERISLPAGITSIDESAFKSCTALLSVELPTSLIQIGKSAFNECTKLTKMDIPDAVIEIGSSAFNDCAALTTVDLPHSLKRLGADAFYKCTSLRSIEIPASLEECEGYLPYNSTGGPFSGCSALREVAFERGTRHIASHLFEKCDGIESISLPSGITSIDESAFYLCTALTSVDIPDTVTNIGPDAFNGCTALATVDLSRSLKKLGADAFYKCTALRSIEIPASLEKCEGFLAYNYSGGPFSGCSALREVTFERGATRVASHLFEKCDGIESISLPSGITSIDDSAFFSCPALASMGLPASLTKIGSSAFYDCTALATIQLPKNLSDIGSSAFYGCSKLNEIAIPSSLTTLSASLFSQCESLSKVTLPNSLTSIGDNCFRGCISLSSLLIPESIKTIGASSFNGCTSLTAIKIPNSVTKLGSSIFSGCTNLTDVKLGSGITAIPSSAFSGCSSLQEIILPYSTQEVQNSSFATCTALKTITIPALTSSISDSAFSYTTFTIRGVKDSAAETYAQKKGITFVENKTEATDVQIDTKKMTLSKGDTSTLALAVSPADFSNEVIWASSNDSVATVQNGRVTAKGVGTATIRVRVGSCMANCEVTVFQPVTSLYLSQSTLSLFQTGSSAQLSATVRPSDALNKTLSWKSSDESVATVSSTGLVTAKGRGSAVITASSTDGSQKSATCRVTVENDLKRVGSLGSFESPHNYQSDSSTIWEYTHQGAQSLNVTFDGRTNVDNGFDYLYIYTRNNDLVGSFTGTQLAGKTVTISGDTVKVRLSSSAAGMPQWGFKVTAVTPVNASNGNQEPSSPGNQGSKPTPAPGTTTAKPQPSTPQVTSIADAEVIVKDKAYTGKTLKPSSVVVKVGGRTLRQGADYTVACKGGKKIGAYTVTIKGKGSYTGTATAKFNVVPKGVTAKKPSAAKRGFTAKWKRPASKYLKQTTGYEVMWAADKKFTKNKKSKLVKGAKKMSLKVTKLKPKKTYYVKVRAYKQVGKTKYYSSWSKVQKVKTKK